MENTVLLTELNFPSKLKEAAHICNMRMSYVNAYCPYYLLLSPKMSLGEEEQPEPSQCFSCNCEEGTLQPVP